MSGLWANFSEASAKLSEIERKFSDSISLKLNSECFTLWTDFERIFLLSEPWAKLSGCWVKQSEFERWFQEGWAKCERISANRQRNLARSSENLMNSISLKRIFLVILKKPNISERFTLSERISSGFFFLSEPWAKLSGCWAKQSEFERRFQEGWADCERISAKHQRNLAKASGNLVIQ